MSIITAPEPRPSPTPTRMPRPSASRGGRRYIRVLTVVSLLVGVAAAAIYLYVSRGVIGSGRAVETYVVTRRSFPVVLNEKGELQAKNSVDVKCEVPGRSTLIWLIEEGAEVKKGDPLFRLASNEIDDRIRAEQITVKNAEATAEAATQELEILLDQNASDVGLAERNLENATIELKKYLEGDFIQQKLEKELALERAKRLLEQAQSIEVDSAKLNERGFITKREYDDKVLRAYEAEIAVKQAEVDLFTFNTYTHPKDEATKRADVIEAEKELDRTRKRAAAKEAQQRATTEARRAELSLVTDRLNQYLDEKAKSEVFAPADGLVVYYSESRRWGSSNEIVEGAEVFERQTIITLPDTSLMQVKFRIHESRTGKIAIGQKATVEVEGLPGVVLKGEVTRIAPLADSQNSWFNPDLKEYDAEITLEKNSHPLKPGVTARAEIVVQTVTNSLAVPIQAVYSRGAHSYVFVGRDQGSAEPVVVTTGVSSDQYIDIKKGLNEGDVVLLAISENMISRIPTQSDADAEDEATLDPAPVVDNAGAIPSRPAPQAGGREGPPRERRAGGGRSRG